MAKIVDHDERRAEILRKAIRLFSETGYQQVTFQQLAGVCGLSRTAFYKYFKSKRDIFDCTITLLVQEIAEEVRLRTSRTSGLDAAKKLTLLLEYGVDTCLRYQRLVQTIIEYLIDLRRQGEPVERKILRHTASYRYAVNKIIKEGIASGEFRQVSPSGATDMLFAMLQAVVIKIMFYDDLDRNRLMKHCKIIVTSLKANGGE